MLKGILCVLKAPRMPLSRDDLEEERRKAKHLAMRQALQMLERSPNQLCSSCAEWRETCSKDRRNYCQDIDHFRKAVQKMIDMLAVYVSGSKLRELVESLQLDTRVFTVHGDNRCYAPKDGSSDKLDMSMELQSKQEELQQVSAERDLAKMTLYKVGRQATELKDANQDLEQKLANQEKEIQQRLQRLEKVEERIRSLETHSRSAIFGPEALKVKPSNLLESNWSCRQQPEVEAYLGSHQTRRSIDAEHSHDRSSKVKPCRRDLSLPPASTGAEQQRLDAAVGRLGILEQYGSIARAPLPEVLAARPCKPPVRAKPPKVFEFNREDACIPKALRSRSQAGYLDNSWAKANSSTAMFADFDRVA